MFCYIIIFSTWLTTPSWPFFIFSRCPYRHPSYKCKQTQHKQPAYSSHPKKRRDTVKDKKKAMAKCFFPSINKKRTPADKLQQGRLISHEEEDGVVKVKIVVTKKELKHLIAAMNQRENSSRRRQTMAPQSLEQLFNVLRRKREKKQEVVRSRQGGWQPALQSIPEEF